MISPEKRKAIYIMVKKGKRFCVEQKRPKIKDRDQYRPFWDDKYLARSDCKRLNSGNKITLYRIKNNKIESFRVRSIICRNDYFSSRDQAKEYYDKIKESFDYTITRSSITIFYHNKSFVITASDKRYPKLHKACFDDNISEVVRLLNLKNEVSDCVKISDDNKMKMDGEEVPVGFAKKLANSIVYDTEVIKKFKNRLDENSSKSAKKNLLKFLSYNGACLLEDGRFLAYKYVKNNFHDLYSGTLDYSPGKVVTMPRDSVVENPEISCASGLHVGSWEYSFRSSYKMIICVIDPVDVVSVPNDYDCQKMRCCKVTSVKEITEPIKDSVLPVEYLDS